MIDLEKNLADNHYRVCNRNAEGLDRLKYVFPPEPRETPITFPGLKQTFAVYFNYPKHHFTSKSIVLLTRIGAMVSLESFYDMGRIPLTIGWGNGRVSWVGQKGSKWLTFHTWQGFRERVWQRDKGQCVKCHKEVKHTSQYVCDHILPLYKDGKDWHEDPEMTNFQTLCLTCNKQKTRIDMRRLWKRENINPFNVSLDVPFLAKTSYGHLDRFLT